MTVHVWERIDGKRTVPRLMQYDADVVPRIGDIFMFCPPSDTPRKMVVTEVEWFAWPRGDNEGECYVNIDVWDFADMDEVDDVKDA